MVTIHAHIYGVYVHTHTHTHIYIYDIFNLLEFQITCNSYASCCSCCSFPSRVQLIVTPLMAAHQACLSFTITWSLLKFMSIETVMLSNHLILCCALLLLPSIFPSIRVFSNESALHITGQSIGVSTSLSVLPMNIQD